MLHGKLGEVLLSVLQKYESFLSRGEDELIGYLVGYSCSCAWGTWICYVSYLQGIDYPVQSVSLGPKTVSNC